MAGGCHKAVDSFKGIPSSCILVGYGAGGCVGGGGGVDGEIMRESWMEKKNGRNSSRDEDDEGHDDERVRDGEEKGGNENRGCKRDTERGSSEKYGWRLGRRVQNQVQKLKGKWIREQSEPMLSSSPLQSGSKAALELANKWDEERSVSFLLRPYWRFCPMLDKREGESDPDARWDSDFDSDYYSSIPLSTSYSQTTYPNKDPHLSLRGGAGSKRLDDDERVAKLIWFFAGGVGRAPTGKGLREWKEKARKKREGRTKENAGFLSKIGLGMMSKGKNRSQKIKKERKGDAEGGEGAGDLASGAQAARGGVVGGDTREAGGDIAPGGSEGEVGAGPGNGEGAEGESNVHGGVFGAGSESGDSDRTE